VRLGISAVMQVTKEKIRVSMMTTESGAEVGGNKRGDTTFGMCRLRLRLEERIHHGLLLALDQVVDHLRHEPKTGKRTYQTLR
jgi:hypothetical protein